MNRNVPAIDLEMVLDWAYCEARVWWQLRAAEALQKEPAERKILSGKRLLEEAVRSALYQGYMEREKNQEENACMEIDMVGKFLQPGPNPEISRYRYQCTYNQ